jgi:hypothetical protein
MEADVHTIWISDGGELAKGTNEVLNLDHVSLDSHSSDNPSIAALNTSHILFKVT